MLGRKDKLQEITVSVKTVVTIVLIVAATLFAFQIIEAMIHPITLIFVSFFFALALNPIVTKLSRSLKLKSRTAATAIAYVGVISFLILFFSLVLPPLFSQTSDFIDKLPDTISNVEENEGTIGSFISENEIDEQVEEFVSGWTSDFSRVSNSAVSVANRVVSNLISIVTVLILTFMMLSEGPRWIKTFWRHYPKQRRKDHERVAHRMYEVVINYVNGQVIVAGIGATCAMISLLIITKIFGVTSLNIVALGGLVFLFSLVPTIGTILGSLIVITFSAIASLPMAAVVLVYFIVYQQIENASVQPIIQSRGNDLTPMLVFIAAIIGVGFGGILGAFVAIPVVGCLKILLEEWIKSREKEKPTA